MGPTPRKCFKMVPVCDTQIYLNLVLAAGGALVVEATCGFSWIAAIATCI